MGSVLRAATVVLAAAVVFSAAPVPAAHSPEAKPKTALKSLARIDDLRASFNSDRGQVRLVLLLSPT